MNFLQDLIKVLQENYLKIFLARFLQDPLYLARKATFLVQDLQDLMKDFASLARKLLARLEYFLQDGFYWEVLVNCTQFKVHFINPVYIHAQTPDLVHIYTVIAWGIFVRS